MTEHNLIGIVSELYEALPKMDWETYESHLHPDFCLVESDALPYAGTFHGMKGFMELIEKVFTLFSEFDAKPGVVCVGEDHVMVWVNIRMTGRNSNKTIDTQLIEVFKFKGDKLAEIRPFYFDTPLIDSIL
jgi:uncharacterized protein